MDRPPQPYQFHFHNVRLFKTDSLGTGSYGAVCKAMCDLLPCAAKLLHPILFQNSGPGARSPRSRFEQECHFLNAMKHPNIVEYLGTTQDPDSGLPVLLMELMDESLTHFLERSHQPLSYHVEVTLCHDIALALDYLHFNDVIHRDLSSNNVLLIAGSRAKVTDFGMSKLLSVNPRMTPYTTCPGTLVYMPPEAIRDPPVYSKKIDSFSFGVVEIQIMTRRFPDPGPAIEMVEDRRYRAGRIQVPIVDSDRRKSHIDLIDPNHPLLPMALHCLNYSEEDRPTAKVLCQEIALLREAPHYTESMEQAQQRGGAAHDTERQLREENAQLSQHNRELQSQLETTTQEVQQNAAALADSQRDNQQLRQELHTKDDTIAARQREVQDTERQLREENAQLSQHNRQLQSQLETTTQELETTTQELQQNTATLVVSQRDNQYLRQELHTKDDTIAARQREVHDTERQLREENAQLSQHNRELQSQLETTTQELETATQEVQQNTATLVVSQRDNQYLRQELHTNNNTLAARQRENQQLRQELHTKDNTLAARQRELAARQRENQQLRQELHTNNNTLAARQRELAAGQRENQQLRQELHTIEESLVGRQREVQQLQRQLQANEQVTAEFQQNLIQREQTICNLEQTVTRLSLGPEEWVKEKQHVPEAKQTPLQQTKQQPQAIARTAMSQKHPKQEPKPSPLPHGMKRGAAADGKSS